MSQLHDCRAIFSRLAQDLGIAGTSRPCALRIRKFVTIPARWTSVYVATARIQRDGEGANRISSGDLGISMDGTFFQASSSSRSDNPSLKDKRPLIHALSSRQRFFAIAAHPKSKPWKCRGMESMESHKAGFPPFPHPLEIPAGFPHSHGYGYDYH